MYLDRIGILTWTKGVVGRPLHKERGNTFITLKPSLSYLVIGFCTETVVVGGPDRMGLSPTG